MISSASRHGEIVLVFLYIVGYQPMQRIVEVDHLQRKLAVLDVECWLRISILYMAKCLRWKNFCGFYSITNLFPQIMALSIVYISLYKHAIPQKFSSK